MPNKNALVIGGGIAGVASALKLADDGYKVYLVEKETAIGGHAASLCCKATERCNKCSVCLVPEKMQAVAAHPQVSLLTNTEVVEAAKKAGNFHIRLIQKPRFIGPEKCTACGMCAESCPAEPKGIHAPSPEAIPPAYVIDKGQCLHFRGGTCSVCKDRCPFEAINLDATPEKIELEVSAVIVATGFDVFDAKKKALLGYGRYPNVLTGFDVEKMLRAEGSITLPSNGKEPQDVAFIQCVGSRDEYIGNGYCSQVCCKYAMRLAKLLQYQNPEMKITIFYMDLQTAGKGFAEFYEECQKTIRFVRGMPVEVSEASPDELIVKHEDLATAKVATEKHDLVILSMGLTPRSDSPHLANILGINLGDYGFFHTPDPLDTVETNVAGVFLAGTCQGPRDIPESIAHGIQAASKVIQTAGVIK